MGTTWVRHKYCDTYIDTQVKNCLLWSSTGTPVSSLHAAAELLHAAAELSVAENKIHISIQK